MSNAATMTNAEKEARFRFPSHDVIALGRHANCTATAGGLWTVIQHARGRTCALGLRTPTGTRVVVSPGHAYQQAIAANKAGETAIVWTAAADRWWKLFFAALPEADAPEPVATGTEVIQEPSIIADGDEWWVAWAAPVAGVNRIHLARRTAARWQPHGPISGPDHDANRPRLGLDGGRLLIVWDGYHAPDSRIHWRFLDSDSEQSIGAAGERWLRPTLAGNLAAWVVLQPVVDSRGIVDWQASIQATHLSATGATAAPDGANRFVGDLREGLLARNTSKGYVGRRRHPQLCQVGNRTWLCWEVRAEDEQTAVVGYLAGREWLTTGWGPTVRLCRLGYGYAVPPSAPEPMLPVAYLDFDREGLDVLRHTELSLGGTPEPAVPGGWDHWRVAAPPPLIKPGCDIDIAGKPHRFFWADTHCHSNLCPDAEGEPDEVIRMARDLAGLDALCLIDNDYYPHKAFTPAEWLFNQALSRQFTREGQFVLFPGYEFTYHRRDLHPDFNHRCVMFPRPPGDRHLFRRIDAESDTDHKLLDCLRQTAGMCYPHHCTFELIDPAREWLVEICSSWRVVFEENDFALRQLLAGHRFGFVGSSDAHRANAGLGGALTGILATELTPEALFDAYRQRRTIATQGFALDADFRAAGQVIGGEGESDGTVGITADITAADTIEFVEVHRGESVVRRITPGALTCQFELMDKPGPGTHFYYLRVKLVGDPAFNGDPARNSRAPFVLDSRYPHNLAKARGVFAWSSPIWITVK